MASSANVPDEICQKMYILLACIIFDMFNALLNYESNMSEKPAVAVSIMTEQVFSGQCPWISL